MTQDSGPTALPERLKAQWVAQGAKVRPGVTGEALRNFEAVHAVCLPQDMRDYFLAVDGMEEVDTMTGNFFFFWPLHAVKTVSEELGPEAQAGIIESNQYFLFADYCLWCWGYAIRLTNNPTGDNSVFCTGSSLDNAGVVAGSFTEFVELYLADDAAIY